MHRAEILRLNAEGKRPGEIAKALGISINRVNYHIDPEYRAAVKESSVRFKSRHPFAKKMGHFTERKKLFDRSNPEDRRKKVKSKFTTSQLIEKLGSYPICYLTGRPVDLSAVETYNFDHIIPVSKGGDNSLENLGLAVKEANQAKCDLSVDEFLRLCEEVLVHHGARVTWTNEAQ